MDLRLPRLGEGADSGTVISVAVKEGDRIVKGQTIVELENEKAIAPIPSSASGIVKKIHVQQGDKVSVGQVLISLEAAEGAVEEAPPAQAPPAPSGFPPPASPAIRKMAREFGIDLTRIPGSERGGRIRAEDIRAYVRALGEGQSKARQKEGGSKTGERVDFSKWGPVHRAPLSSLRKKIAEKVTRAWTGIPHVTQFEEADITALVELRKKYAPAYEKRGVKLTVTSFALKAAVAALKKYPIFNASFDPFTEEVVYKEYYHLGVAVDTEQGLIVPVLRDVDKKSLFEISRELGDLAQKTRQRKIALEELKGGTFTISNLGGIGGTFFTPIVNEPEVAILGIGRGVLKPVVQGEKGVVPRTMLPLGLSYDHRVVDGADGARFIREIAEVFENFEENWVKI